MQKQKNRKIFNPGKWSGKPYNFFGDYLAAAYSCRVLKLPIDAGFSCPNRDGTLSFDGCVFCSEEGSASPTTGGLSSIAAQMLNAKNTFRRSEKDTKYIAYFQAFTNTYAPPDKLKMLYDEAVNFPDITGLMIGTRPDCINSEILEVISSYKRENFELWIELGLQSVHDRSLEYLNRQHSFKQTDNALNMIAEYNIPVCVHVILGIPGESWAEMMETAETISKLPVAGVKLHHLHIIKETPLAHIHEKEKFSLMSLKEYVSTVCDFIERLRPDILIHRLMGDRMEESLIQPKWGLHKGTVIQAIEDEFSRRCTFQGFLYTEGDGK